MQGKVIGSEHRAIKVLLTLQLILCASLLGLSRQFYTEATGGFFSLALGSIVIMHLRIRPRWVDAMLVVLITAFLAIVNFYVFHSPERITTWYSFLGLSSFVIMAGRTIWERERKFLLYAWVPAAVLIMSDRYLARALHEWTAQAHPKTLDLYLLSFDGSLHVQLAFIVGQYYARHSWLHNSALLAYVGLAIPITLVYTGRLIRFRQGAFPSMLAFIIAGPIGVLFYNLFPACGPHYLFKQDFPFHPLPIAILSRLTLEPAAISGWRNAMPSLHLAWTLLAWWYSKGLSWIERLVAFAFLALTVVATLGTGEHWFVDLIVAFPFALSIQAICAHHLSWKDSGRRTALVLGLGGTLGWMAMLRYGTGFFWTSPVVPWALSVATIALVLLRQAKLDSVANLRKLAAGVHSVPAPCPLDDASDLAV